jgi:MbtH protein
MFEDDDEQRVYTVVRNHEEQYSIWPDGLGVPAGWDPVGISGPKSVCLTAISEMWTDLLPKSLRL